MQTTLGSEVKYEYHYGFCENAQDIALPFAVGITVLITIKLAFTFVLALRKKKDGKETNSS